MIGDRVKAARVAAKMSQGEVVRLMNNRHGATWHQTTISRIENGKRDLNLNEAAALSEVLCVTLDHLAYGTSVPSVDEWHSLAHKQDRALLHIEQVVKDAVAVVLS